MRALVAGLLLALALAGTAVLPLARADELTPRDATGYRNGRRIPLQLVQLGWADVEVTTARVFVAMREAAAASGVELTIRSGWRSQEQQAWLYQAWRDGHGAKAAKPGYSQHQAGRALDLDLDEASYAWLQQHARRFGFRRTVRGEPWHWELVRVPRAFLPRRAARPAARPTTRPTTRPAARPTARSAARRRH
jgi:D-alanyl-D-alanine carboxypeptidase